MKVTSKINIDLRHPNVGVLVDAVQGDVNTRAVEISLFDGGAVWTVPSGVTAALAYKKPDSQQGCLDDSATITVSGSTITIVMTKQMLATPGTVNACVVLTDASKNQLTSFPFSVSVAANPAADVQQSDETIKVDTSDATAAAEDIVAGKTAYVDGKKVTGTHECASGEPNLQSKTVAPSESQQTVSPDSGYDGLSDVTVEAVSSTYVGSGVTKKSAATYTPGTADQTIASGQYLSGKQTIKGDANLLSVNIKSGVTVFGVDGTYAGTGDLDTSDATATAEDMAEGVTAYVNGQKITGTVPEKAELRKYDATPETILFVSGSGDGRNGAYINIKSELDESDEKSIVSPGTVLSQIVEPVQFGDAIASDVVAGKTFTSAAGLKVTGTHECSEGGIDTSDATAAAADILSGKTAYVNGEKITGTHVCQTGTGGLTVKTGTTTSAVFDIGLSELKALLLYTTTINRVGLVNAAYIDGSEKGIVSGIRSYSYTPAFSFYTEVNLYFTFADGTVTWSTDEGTAGFVEGDTYTWVAVGIE